MPQILKDSLMKMISSDLKLSLYTSGGCTSILGWLSLLPGSSKVIVETQNPYSKSALMTLLGYKPNSFVNLKTAKDLSLKAFVNCQRLLYLESDNKIQFEQDRILGVGITGALRSNYEKKGLHHVYVTLMDQKNSTTYYINLEKTSNRSREEEDQFIGLNIINLINSSNKLPTLIGETFDSDSISVVENVDTIDSVFPLLSDGIMNIIYLPNGKYLVNQILKKCAVIPGSFNPIHEGHIALGEEIANCQQISKEDVIFELSAANPDKGEISRKEIETRISAIVEKGFSAMLTKIPFFYSKNEYLRDGYFIVGADTYKRIVNVKYYDNSRDIMISKLTEFAKYQNNLIVAPRLNPETDKVESLKDFEIPDILKGLAKEVEFRKDISSTEIRNKNMK